MKKQGYLYDTHVHTSLGSACGVATGKMQAIAHKEAGYAGMIITEHFFNGNSAVNADMSWEEKVNILCSGYEEAKEVGDRIGLTVLFGWEACFGGIEFLIYGLDKEWLLGHEEIMDWSIEEQYQKITEAGGMVIQAHPYREAWYIKETRQYPEYVDGIEMRNSANDNRNPAYNDKAEVLAKKYDFPVTAGSDSHSVDDIYGGMIFDEPIKDIKDFITRVKSKSGYKLKERNL